MLILRQTYFQNFLSVLLFILIICYYVFNGISEESFTYQHYSVKKVAEYENNLAFEKNVSQLSAAILMDADVVQINGLLYQLELTAANISSNNEARKQIERIYDLLLKDNKKAAIRRINYLHTYLLKSKRLN